MEAPKTPLPPEDVFLVSKTLNEIQKLGDCVLMVVVRRHPVESDYCSVSVKSPVDTKETSDILKAALSIVAMNNKRTVRDNQNPN